LADVFFGKFPSTTNLLWTSALSLVVQFWRIKQTRKPLRFFMARRVLKDIQGRVQPAIRVGTRPALTRAARLGTTEQTVENIAAARRIAAKRYTGGKPP
jgi:hypothetical protein